MALEEPPSKEEGEMARWEGLAVAVAFIWASRGWGKSVPWGHVRKGQGRRANRDQVLGSLGIELPDRRYPRRDYGRGALSDGQVFGEVALGLDGVIFKQLLVTQRALHVARFSSGEDASDEVAIKAVGDATGTEVVPGAVVEVDEAEKGEGGEAEGGEEAV